MLTIKQSMELAGRNLLHCLRPEDQFRPLWGVDIEPDFRATCRRSRFEHNVGRWWDAVLRLEAATGFEIPAELEEAMLRNLGDCLDNPLSVCAPVDPAASCFDGHTQREILLALSALVRWRDNDWAKEAGHRMILALDRFFQDNGEWNLALMNRDRRATGKTRRCDERSRWQRRCRVVAHPRPHDRGAAGVLHVRRRHRSHAPRHSSG